MRTKEANREPMDVCRARLAATVQSRGPPLWEAAEASELATRPLPGDVVYYEVPQPLLVQIGPPPSGYRYMRVASDILMLAIGTGMVVDAIQDLGR
jgi:hypothetical protein